MGGGTGSETFGAWYHLLVGAMTLIVCLVSRYLLKGVYKNLNILVGLVFGYVISAVFTAAGIAPMIDFFGNHEDDRGSRIFQSSETCVLDRT